MNTTRWMPTVTPKRAEPTGLNNDCARDGKYTPAIPALKFVDWYLSQLPR